MAAKEEGNVNKINPVIVQLNAGEYKPAKQMSSAEITKESSKKSESTETTETTKISKPMSYEEYIKQPVIVEHRFGTSQPWADMFSRWFRNEPAKAFDSKSFEYVLPR
jgi:hypothetical protein